MKSYFKSVFSSATRWNCEEATPIRGLGSAASFAGHLKPLRAVCALSTCLGLSFAFATGLCSSMRGASPAMPGGSDQPPALTEATNEVQQLPPLNLGLRESVKLIDTTNLLGSAHGPDRKNRPDKWQTLFELAQKQHQQKDYAQCNRNFAAAVEGDTPEEMKRSALIELAVVAQEQEQFGKAQQILAQYLKRYAQDPSVPEVLLRQGLVYRQMGASSLALSKFYAVMTSALSLKRGAVGYYQRLVLQAQTEVAETFYLDGKYEEAAGYFNRLLKLDSKEINRPQIQFKMLRCLAAAAKHTEAVACAEEFLRSYPGAVEEAEVRFLLASSLKQLGRNKEALEQVLVLLRTQQGGKDEALWTYWQRRAGNHIANQMYQEGDYVGALEVYSALEPLDESPAWQVPVWYQMGLVYERLQQPEKAQELYGRIAVREKELASDVRPGLKTVLDMAKWRNEFLSWQTKAELFIRTNAQLKALPPLSAAR